MNNFTLIGTIAREPVVEVDRQDRSYTRILLEVFSVDRSGSIRVPLSLPGDLVFNGLAAGMDVVINGFIGVSTDGKYPMVVAKTCRERKGPVEF